MNCLREAASRSTPQKSLFLKGAIAAENPVPTGLMKTRSVLSKRLSGLSSIAYGAGGMNPGKLVLIRFGAKDPKSTHTADDPGPPLYRKVTGRVLASAP